MSRATVRGKDRAQIELYRQEGAYHLPPGHIKPRTKHKLRLKGGKKKQDVTLKTHDPELRIARITVELYGDDHQPGGGEGEQEAAAERLEIENRPVTCPPFCDF